MLRAASVIALCACGSAPPPPPTPPPTPQPAQITIAESECIDATATTARLEGVLAAHRATYADLVIRVDATASEGATTLQLRVTRSTTKGGGLDRSYTLGPSDCASSTELVALGVDRFLSAFPDWAGPAPVPPPPRPPRARWVDVAVIGAAGAMFEPVGIDAHVGGAIDYGARRHRAGGTLLVRASVPQAAGEGSFQQTAFLAGAAYRFRDGAWSVRVEARAGALLVSGLGLEENNSDWLPWWEGAVFAGRAFSWGALGVEVAASGLRHKAVTRDGLVEEDIPLLRLGFAGELGVWSTKP